MKKLLSLILSSLFFLIIATNPAAAEIRLKAGHTLAPTHPYQLGLEHLAKLLNERTNGEIVLDVFHSSQLGSERELIEAIQLGTVDLTIVSTAPLAGFTKDFLVYDLPFLFPDTATARRVMDSPIGQKALTSVDKIGLVGLTYFENGFRHVTNSKLPILKPEDARGIKIRTMENKIHMASFRAVGATPVPMAFGELYTALQQKTIDAEENPIPIIFTSKFFEVQKYCSLTGHFYAPTPMFINKGTWNKLSDEQKKIFQEAVKEAAEFERSEIDKQNNDFISELKNNGMVIDEVDKAIWLKAMEPVYKEFEAEIGANVIKDVQDEIAKK